MLDRAEELGKILYVHRPSSLSSEPLASSSRPYSPHLRSLTASQPSRQPLESLTDLSSLDDLSDSERTCVFRWPKVSSISGRVEIESFADSWRLLARFGIKAGSMTLEMTRLSQLTGNQTYFNFVSLHFRFPARIPVPPLCRDTAFHPPPLPLPQIPLRLVAHSRLDFFVSSTSPGSTSHRRNRHSPLASIIVPSSHAHELRSRRDRQVQGDLHFRWIW